MRIRKDTAGGDSYGNRWPKDGAVVDVDDAQGAALLAMPHGGFTDASAEPDEQDPIDPAEQERIDSELAAERARLAAAVAASAGAGIDGGEQSDAGARSQASAVDPAVGNPHGVGNVDPTGAPAGEPVVVVADPVVEPIVVEVTEPAPKPEPVKRRRGGAAPSGS